MASTTQSPAIPPTMRAWVRQQRGPARTALKLVNDLPTPAIPTGSSTDVLIRVSYVSLQVTTELVIKLLPKLPFTGPWIPDMELSGTVVAAGSGARSDVREPGTRVAAFQNVPNVFLGNGVMAEYARLPSSQVVSVDEGVDMAEVSGVNCNGSTALKMIRRAGVREGHSVLVNGASGSIGSVAVQLCKMRGAKVVGVASGGNEEMVRGLGADEFVDYKRHDPVTAYLAEKYGNKPFDFVLDCVGTQALYVNSPSYLKPEGALVNIGALEGVAVTMRNRLFNEWLPVWLGGVPRRYIMFSTLPNYEDTVYVVRLIEEGRLRNPVDSVFDMEDVVSSYERIATQRARGKVVIKVRSD